MSISTSALTLAQYAIQSNDPRVLKITYSLLENGNVLADIPLFNNKTLIANGVRWTGNLPSINWAKINTDPVVTSGTPAAYSESAFIVRNAIDVDKYLVEDKNQIVDPRGAQVSAWLKGFTYDVNDKFLNNDPVTGNADAMVGLKYRIANPSTYGVNTDMSIDAGGVDMTLAAGTAATANQFIYYVQALLDYMGAPEGDGVVLYMNDYMKRLFEAAMRRMGTAGGLNITKDQFDRTLLNYKNARLQDIGRKADQSTRIISNTETNTGAAGSSNYTSIYGVRYGEETAYGWQFEELQAQDVQMIGNGGATYRTVINWACGLMFPHTRAIGRIYDIKTS